jgi:4-hydroxy-4-methyl-2-oxoglutarate aldolase
MATELSAKERTELLELFGPLRVADVSDGMDWNMLHDIGLVSHDIRPVWRPVRFCGFAKTVRYVPTNRKVPTMAPEEYSDFVREWYRDICRYPFGDLLQPGDVLCVDASNLDVGLLGSNNVLSYMEKGIAGVVTNGGCRDTDEIILQKCPVFSRFISRTMVQARLEFSDMMNPVDIGGVLVRPNDVVVADGDGVIVVPLEKAYDVARYAHQELSGDKKGRRQLYQAMGMPLDDTVL